MVTTIACTCGNLVNATANYCSNCGMAVERLLFRIEPEKPNPDAPRVFLVAKSELVDGGVRAYLESIGNPAWAPDLSISDGENLIEVAGRLCYRSWQPYNPKKPEATNPNVTKVREGNDEYLNNLLKSGHTSVLEHVSMTFITNHVSRVFTHELVRHRVGAAYSQESLRYVRLEDMHFWNPPGVTGKVAEIFDTTLKQLRQAQKDLGKIIVDAGITDFDTKKKMTSMFRRIAPIGLSTSIMFTLNLRTLRHVIRMRTSPHAEEEARLVFDTIAAICKREYPNVFQDMQRTQDGEWRFENLC